MSDNQPINKVINIGEWWWLAGYIRWHADTTISRLQRATFPPVSWKETSISGGVRIEGFAEDRPVLFLQITSSKQQTFIITSDHFPFEGFWAPIIKSCLTLETYVRSFRRLATSRRFEELLNDFYHRRAHGQSPNLRKMAEDYDVNYGSLRQYKIKYDREMQKLLASEGNI